MPNWKRAVPAAAGYLLILVLGAFVGPRPGGAQGHEPPKPVIVTNTPLPVNGNVNATVGGTVQAQQSGDWNVGINGTPNVNVTGLPAVQLAAGSSVGISGTPTVQLAPGANVGISGAPTVTIGNTPVPVVNVGGAALQPYQKSIILDFEPGDFTLDSVIDVPAGKRFVIEHASATVFAGTGRPTFWKITTTNSAGNGSDQLADHYLVPFQLQPDVTGGVAVASEELRTTSDAPVMIHFERDAIGGNAAGEVTLSGYLIDP